MLVFFAIPAISLLFLQNKQVQTSVSEFLTEKLSEDIGTEISVSYVHYSFFKRLQLYDLYIEDLNGDTLIYSEITHIRIKKFNPRRKNIHIRKILFDNAFLNMSVDESRTNSLQFLVDTLNQGLPPEEKSIVRIDNMDFTDSRFRQRNINVIPTPTGIDFRDLYVKNVQVEIDNFMFKMDTTSLTVANASGIEQNGFIMNEVGFDMLYSLTFMTFSNGRIITPGSVARIPKVHFEYSSPKNFKYVYDSVDMQISSLNSDLDFYDISYFFPQLVDLHGSVSLTGEIQGKFKDFAGENMKIKYKENSLLNFDLHLLGLPSPDSLFMDFNFKNLITTAEDFTELTSNYEIDFLKDTALLNTLNLLKFQGVFAGYQNDFKTSGVLSAAPGSIDLDLNVRPDTANILTYKGTISSENLNIGELLNKESYISEIDFSLAVDGKSNNGKTILEVDGIIDTIGVYNYDYSNIMLTGLLSNRTFDGSFFIKDPNIDLSFAGAIDFEKTIPQMNFTIDVAKLRPYYLNLNTDDPEYFASFFLKTNLEGIRLNEINGEVQLVNSLLRRTGSQIQVYDLLLKAENTIDTSLIELRSDMIDAEIRGNYNFESLPGCISNLINDHFEIISPGKFETDSSVNFEFDINFKNANPVMEFFFPTFRIAKGSTLEGKYAPVKDSYEFSLNGDLPYFSFKSYTIDQLAIQAFADTTALQLDLEGISLSSLNGLEIIKPSLSTSLSRNNSILEATWDNNTTPRYSGKLKIDGFLDKSQNLGNQYTMRISPSEFYYNNRKFNINKSGICIAKDRLCFDSVMVEGANQLLLADGIISQSEEDSLSISLANINLGLVNDLNADFLLELDGSLSGLTTIKKKAGKPMLSTSLLADSLCINKECLGDSRIDAKWDESAQMLDIEVNSQKGIQNEVHLAGSYSPISEQVDMDINITGLGLRALQPYLETTLEDISGRTNITGSLHGSLSKPVLNGNIDLIDANVKVIPTQVSYTSSDRIRIHKNDLFFEDFLIKDYRNHDLRVNGNILTSNFQDLIFNLNIAADNINFLSTNRMDNEQFYGNVFASANADIRGNMNRLSVNVLAQTERNTKLFLPLYNATEVQSSDYITFINAEEDEDDMESSEEKSTIVTLDMDLTVASGASVQMIFDPNVGDIIDASGNGKLIVRLDEKGNLSLFGDVFIEDGEYQLTIQNVINKPLKVKEGSSISWNGDPAEAQIDLEAFYATKASLVNLTPDPEAARDNEELRKKRAVHCILALDGDLTSPTISPDIKLPTTTETSNLALLESSIGTDEDMMRQFISLLIFNNFIHTAGTGIGISPTGIAGVTASELLSNWLSNWISQISNDLDLGFMYHPGDLSQGSPGEYSNEEIEFALRYKLTDRFIISGNVDYLPSDEIYNTNIVGDFDLEFIVSDNISVKAFNRVNDDMISRQELYTQGVGLQYRSEFTRISDLFRRKEKKKDGSTGSPTKDKKEDQENSGEAVLKEDE